MHAFTTHSLTHSHKLLKGIFFGFLLTFLSLGNFVSSASAYYTNMPASVVIGQPDFTSNSTGTTASQVNGLGDQIIIVNGKLIVPDQSNHRVLIWNSVPTQNNTPADIVIGQPDFTSGLANQGGSVGANTLYNPARVISDGTRLFISDFSNKRILIFNHIPTTNNASADVVIGQPDFTSNTANQGGSAAANTLYNPASMLLMGEKLLIADYANRRVLIFNTIPISNNASADVVIGQTNMTNNSPNQGGSVGANTLNLVTGLMTDGTRLIVVDGGSNHRVLIFNSIPTSNNASANVVIGQQNFTSNSANQGGSAAANTFNIPSQGFVDDKGRLYISDYSNNRALIFNQIPTTNNASADIVLGQPDMVTTSSGLAANRVNTAWEYMCRGINSFLQIEPTIVFLSSTTFSLLPELA